MTTLTPHGVVLMITWEHSWSSDWRIWQLNKHELLLWSSANPTSTGLTPLGDVVLREYLSLPNCKRGKTSRSFPNVLCFSRHAALALMDHSASFPICSLIRASAPCRWGWCLFIPVSSVWQNAQLIVGAQGILYYKKDNYLITMLTFC